MNLKLPNTYGNFGVGKSIQVLTDESRQEKYDSGKRRIITYIFYPSDTKAGSPYAHDIIDILKNNLQQSLATDASRLDYLNTLVEATALNAPLAPGVFPILFFFPGLGDPVETYTILLQELASHGYIVVGVNPPYAVDPTIFPDGHVVRMNSELASFWYAPDDKFEKILDDEHETWLKDGNFIIDCIKNRTQHNQLDFLKNKIDDDQIGVFGHSFGGSLALQLCRDRNDIKACVDLDGIMFGPAIKRMNLLRVPAMFIVADKETSDQELEQYKIARTKYDQLVVPRHPRLLYNMLKDAYYATIRSSDHNSFSDLNLLKSPITKAGNSLQVLEKIQLLVLNFFNSYLKNKPLDKRNFETIQDIIFESKNNK